MAVCLRNNTALKTSSSAPNIVDSKPAASNNRPGCMGGKCSQSTSSMSVQGIIAADCIGTKCSNTVATKDAAVGKIPKSSIPDICNNNKCRQIRSNVPMRANDSIAKSAIVNDITCKGQKCPLVSNNAKNRTRCTLLPASTSKISNSKSSYRSPSPKAAASSQFYLTPSNQNKPVACIGGKCAVGSKSTKTLNCGNSSDRSKCRLPSGSTSKTISKSTIVNHITGKGQNCPLASSNAKNKTRCTLLPALTSKISNSKSSYQTPSPTIITKPHFSPPANQNKPMVCIGGKCAVGSKTTEPLNCRNLNSADRSKCGLPADNASITRSRKTATQTNTPKETTKPQCKLPTSTQQPVRKCNLSFQSELCQAPLPNLKCKISTQSSEAPQTALSPIRKHNLDGRSSQSNVNDAPRGDNARGLQLGIHDSTKTTSHYDSLLQFIEWAGFDDDKHRKGKPGTSLPPRPTKCAQSIIPTPSCSIPLPIPTTQCSIPLPSRTPLCSIPLPSPTPQCSVALSSLTPTVTPTPVALGNPEEDKKEANSSTASQIAPVVTPVLLNNKIASSSQKGSSDGGSRVSHGVSVGILMLLSMIVIELL